MYRISIPAAGAFALWRDAARSAISHRIPSDRIEWSDAAGLFTAAPLPDTPGPHQARVPAAFLKLAGAVVWHSDPERFALLYAALWRLDRGRGCDTCRRSSGRAACCDGEIGAA